MLHLFFLHYQLLHASARFLLHTVPCWEHSTKTSARPLPCCLITYLTTAAAVFKLDIDHAESETAILQALLDDPQASALVDEFFFEYHVTFGEMLRYWKSQADPAKSLADAFALFYELRQRGWRAHSWV